MLRFQYYLANTSVRVYVISPLATHGRILKFVIIFYFHVPVHDGRVSAGPLAHCYLVRHLDWSVILELDNKYSKMCIFEIDCRYRKV